MVMITRLKVILLRIWFFHTINKDGIQKPVELVLETFDVAFSDIEYPESVHDMISRWQIYADQNGYGFDCDMELYEFLDEHRSWSYTGN